MITNEIINYLRIDKLKNNYIYNIQARNAKYGVWIELEKAFMISRWKFKRNYLFYEYHWDTGEPFGTVKPIKLIEKFPFEFQNNFANYSETKYKEILRYLDSLDDNLKNIAHKGFGEIQKDLSLKRKKYNKKEKK